MKIVFDDGIFALLNHFHTVYAVPLRPVLNSYEAIQNTPKLANLTLADVKANDEGKPLAMCYTDGVNKDTAVVVFKGTTGYGDWYDNFQGLFESDTKRQQEALDYLTEDWIGVDQKAFVQAGIGL